MRQFRILMRMEKKSMIAWSLGSGGFVAMMGLIFVAMGGGEGLSELAETYPPEILEALGASDLASIKGFLGAEFGALAPVVFGIYLVMLMTKHLAGAEESGRIDHSLARPVSRTGYYWSVLAAGAAVFACIIAVSALMGLIGFAGVASGNEFAQIVAIMLDMLPFGLLFVALGGFLGALFHTRGVANAIGAAIVVASFALDMVSRILDDYEWLGYLTPVGYLSRSDLASGSPDLGYLVFCTVLGALASIGGWAIFNRKQLYA